MNVKDVIAGLGALAQEHRLAAFRELVQQGPDGLPAGVLAERLGLAPATLSFHLSQLSNAGLVASRRQGRLIIYSVDVGRFQALLGFLTENCCQGNADLCQPRPGVRAGGCAPTGD
ncbi:ArsR family transcriptional regulator [Azospirillum brasilense]|uniref:ArsR family transcriptional regulator n=1 Tax=Azospirillum brasilense TaxID=192 RepID=A0A560B1L3_AZOBR|nr:metalloregulator ArsR/SmtB family transcription factor [Azospirillum brasilense]TWA66399.1 ArsR family transcriptional regulator [Azospirillum brasilense]